MVNGPSPGPAPADQARASSSRLTRSSWRTWPHRKLRRKVPRVDGALTTQPMALAVPPVRSTSASSMQSPPARAEATSVITLSPVLARPGARPRSRCRSTSSGRPRCRPSVAGRISPALATRRWSSKAIWMRSGWSSASIFWVLLAWGRFPVSKAIIPDAQEHFLTPSAHRDTHLFGGLGLKHVLRRDWIAFMSAATAKPCWHILLLRFEHLIKLDVAFLHEFIHLLRHRPDLLRHWVTFAVG